jgi:hypothetical protein
MDTHQQSLDHAIQELTALAVAMVQELKVDLAPMDLAAKSRWLTAANKAFSLLDRIRRADERRQIWKRKLTDTANHRRTRSDSKSTKEILDDRVGSEINELWSEEFEAKTSMPHQSPLLRPSSEIFDESLPSIRVPTRQEANGRASRK